MDLNGIYKTCYEDIHNSLQKEVLYESVVHGIGHIERTLILGSLIAQNECLDEHETRMALLCCAYHDIGRHTDWYDPVHGTASATRIRYGHVKDLFDNYSDDDMHIILCSIAAHSDHDSNLQRYEKSYSIENHDRFERVVKCLKDADALDRVRLDKLDPSYLRYEKSHELVDFAWELLRKYKAEHGSI